MSFHGVLWAQGEDTFALIFKLEKNYFIKTLADQHLANF